MKIGSLYTVKKFFWLLFPTKEIAGTRSVTGRFSIIPTAFQLDWFGKCEVTSPDSIIVLLEEDGQFKKFLTSDGKLGWTWLDENDIDCFEEMKG